MCSMWKPLTSGKINIFFLKIIKKNYQSGQKRIEEDKRKRGKDNTHLKIFLPLMHIRNRAIFYRIDLSYIFSCKYRAALR